MDQNPSTEVVVKTAAAPRKRPVKQTLRAVGAGAFSVAMVGMFAFPAFATTQPQTAEVETSQAQLFSTSAASNVAIPAHLPTAEEEPLPEPQIIAEEVALRSFFEIPAGAGADGIVNAALAQLDVGQDCTDLVQNSLSALGLVRPRLQGGPDLGTGVGTWAQFGYEVMDGSLAPGDILIWPGEHVAIYIGGGMAVHGGWTNGGRNAETTVIYSADVSFNAARHTVRVG